MTLLAVGSVAEAEDGCVKDMDCEGEKICEEGECVDPPEPEPEGAPEPVVEAAEPAEPVEEQKGCKSDTECKGIRICEEGTCVMPPGWTPGQPPPQPVPAPAPAAPPPPAPPPTAPAPPEAWEPEPEPPPPVVPYERGYASLTYLSWFLSYGTWKSEYEGATTEGKLDHEYNGGMRLAGYGVVNDNVHVGGYWSFARGTIHVRSDTPGGGTSQLFWATQTTNSLGLAFKAGHAARDSIWLGLGLDLGVAFKSGAADIQGEERDLKTIVGLHAFPRFDMEFILSNSNSGFKFGLLATIGAYILPVMSGHPLDTDEMDNIDAKVTIWRIGPAVLLGFLLGA
jgi:hypothetical protein